MNQHLDTTTISPEEAVDLLGTGDRVYQLFCEARDLLRLVEPQWVWEEEALCERTQIFDRLGKIFLDLLTCERGDRANELTPLLDLYWRHLQLLQQNLGLVREAAYTSYMMCLRLIPLLYAQLLDHHRARLWHDDFHVDINGFYR